MEANVGRNLLQAFVKILGSLECPICCNYVSTPIFQCCSGHILCGTCKKGIDVCPTCRAKMPNPEVRVRSLEDIAAEMVFPCRNDGCDKILALEELKSHEDICEHANASANRVTEKDRHSQQNYSTLLLHVEQQLSPFFVTEKAVLHQEIQTEVPNRSGEGPINVDENDVSFDDKFLHLISNSKCFDDKNNEISNLNEFLKERLFSTESKSESLQLLMDGMDKISLSKSSSQTGSNEDITEDVSQILSESSLNSSAQKSKYKLKDKIYHSVSGDEDSDTDDNINNSSENLSDFTKLLQTLLINDNDNDNSNSEELNVEHSDSESNLQTTNTPHCDNLTKLVQNLLPENNNTNSFKGFNMGRNTPPKKNKVNSSQKKRNDKHTLKNKAATNKKPSNFSQSYNRLMSNMLEEQEDVESDNKLQ